MEEEGGRAKKKRSAERLLRLILIIGIGIIGMARPTFGIRGIAGEGRKELGSGKLDSKGQHQGSVEATGSPGVQAFLCPIRLGRVSNLSY